MEEEDDPVVEEIPVFISSGLGENLYLLQYPIKGDLNNFDNADVVNCCVKPHNEQIKVDFAVSTKSKNYDSFRGDQLAQQADGIPQPKQHRMGGGGGSSAPPPERPTFPNGRLDKLSYTSAKPSTNVHRYVIGVLNDREVHCTPLKTVLQMRPSFSYFDKKDTRDKVEQKAKAKAAGLEGGEGGNNSESDDEDVRAVTVKFAASDRVKKMREQSYEAHAQRQSEEPWCETMWYASDSGQAELERRKLISNKADMIQHSLGLNSEDYIKNLIPPERKEISIDSFVPSKVVHCAKRLTMSLTDQIKHILIDAKITSFQHLLTLIDKNLHTKDKVLQALTAIGVILRGNWVIQSEVLYPEKSWSALNGIPAEYMCKARDYILFQFTKKTSLSRQKLAEVTQLPAEELKEILLSVSVLNMETKEWELSVSHDYQFEMNNSDLVKRQELVWRSKEEQFAEMEAEKPTTSKVEPSGHSKRVRKRSIREAKD